MPILTVDGTAVPYTTSAKYLGVVFDKRLTWRVHVDGLKKSFHGRLSQVAPLLRSPNITIKTKLMIYCQYIRAALTYAIVAWFGIATGRLASLQVLQNRCLRIIGGFDRQTPIAQMHETLDMPYFIDYARRLADALYQKALYNTNPLISELGAYDPRDFTSHRMPLYHVWNR